MHSIIHMCIVSGIPIMVTVFLCASLKPKTKKSGLSGHKLQKITRVK
jgi:hypothetical protein